MSISQERYVDIASAVIGATAVPQQSQAGRYFTDNIKVGTHEVLSFGTAQAVALLFGASSKEAKFASDYFSYISPAPASRAKEIQFSQLKSSESNAVARGRVDSVEKIKANGINGTISVKDGDDIAVTGDLTSAVSLADVATALTNEKAIFTYDQVNNVFTVSIVDKSEIKSINGLNALGFSDYANNRAFDDSTLTNIYSHSINLNSSFFSAYFDKEATTEEIVDVASFNASFNVRYQLYFVSDKEELSEALINTASAGIVNSKQIVHLPMAIMAAVDYDRANATVNPMYRQAGVTITDLVKDDLEANRLDKLRINYYGQTAVYGSNISFFQRGHLCGTGNAPLDISVHANEQWLKSYITQQWFSMLLSTRGIPANKDGADIASAVIEDAATKARNNGTISIGKNLTVTQRQAITDASNDPNAYIDVQENGYWYGIQFEETQNASNATEYVLKYTLIYAKGDFVRKVEGSHNLV